MAKKIKRKQVEGLDNLDTSNLLQRGGYNGTAKQLKDEIDALKSIVTSDDTDFDTFQEIVNQVKKNKNLKDLLLNKLDKDGYTGTAKTLKEDIDGKAPKEHTHNFDDLTNKPTIKSNKSTTGTSHRIGTDAYEIGTINIPDVPQFNDDLTWQRAIEWLSSSSVPDQISGTVIVCNNSSDIDLSFDDVKEGFMLSIVKVGNGNVNIRYTKGTVIGEQAITGIQGSSASIVVMRNYMVVNVNNK